MKALIPLAGLGSRMQPITHTTAKPLIPVAGKPVLAHILDALVEAKIHEAIFIIGHLGDQVKEWVEEHYGLKCAFITQETLSGQAPAIKLAEAEIDEDVLIWFSDTLTDMDIAKECSTDKDGVIFVKEHEDPKRFGVVETDETGIVTRLIEKPTDPKSNLVNIGLYYIKNWSLLIESIDALIDRDQKTKGEFYLMDAFTIMMEKGGVFEARRVDTWLDTGKPETTLETNRVLLDRRKDRSAVPEGERTIFKQPVHVGEGTTIRNSEIGPHTSIGDHCWIEDCEIKDSIICDHSTVKGGVLERCIVGKHAKVKGTHRDRIIGDRETILE